VKPDASLLAFADEANLAPHGSNAVWTPLSGGVSSDIWRLDVDDKSYCLKRALPRLKVADEWTAPIERNQFEWLWLEAAAAIAPQAVPHLFARDEQGGVFAMAFLPEDSHPLWKAQLLAGRADVGFAASVGDTLGRIHRATAKRADIAARFATDAMFYALRLEPYLLAAAARVPEAAAALRRLATRTGAVHLALVHGDVSPKNLLIGPHGPVFLDAECAWFGDPAFDLAFCLNHLLLKRIAAPRAGAGLAASFEALTKAYASHVDWEARRALEGRAAALLPGLMLARVDGKSPVEYIVTEADKARVRTFAIALLNGPPQTLADINAAWARAPAENEEAE